MISSSCGPCPKRSKVSLLCTSHWGTHDVRAPWWWKCVYKTARCSSRLYIYLKWVVKVHGWVSCGIHNALRLVQFIHISCLVNFGMFFLGLWSRFGQKSWRTTDCDWCIWHFSVQNDRLVSSTKIALRASICKIRPTLCCIVIHLDLIVWTKASFLVKSFRFIVGCTAFWTLGKVHDTYKLEKRHCYYYETSVYLNWLMPLTLQVCRFESFDCTWCVSTALWRHESQVVCLIHWVAMAGRCECLAKLSLTDSRMAIEFPFLW